MTLFDIIRNLQAIAAQEPSVRSVSDGDIYDALNAAVDIKYGVFHITQDTHTTNGDLDVWGLNLFFIDRLLDNNENRLSIQSAGITILENVLKNFADTFGAEYMNNIVYTPFTQRFKDNCAGVFCKISISTVMDNLCAEGGKIVLVKNQDKSIDITENGRYNVTPDYGFSGLGSVDINVDVQGGGCVASEESKTYTANGTYTITPTSGDCISKATVTVNVPSEEPVLQIKSIDIAENGSYSLAPDAGVDGLSNVNINVDVPSAPYVVPDDMSFSSSRFTTFPVEGLDFSQKTNFAECWYGCSNLREFPALDLSKGVNFNSTWYGCSYLTTFPQVDLSSGTDFSYAWYDCNAMQYFSPINMNNATNLDHAWYRCYGIVEFPMIDTSKVTNFRSTWEGCMSLQIFPQFDLSAGTLFISTWKDCNITVMPQLDLSNGVNFNFAWDGCHNLVNLGGFGAIKASIDLSDADVLNVDSIMNVITQAADLNELGITGKTMTFGSTNLAKLTDAQKGVATSKGWSLA